LGKGEWDGGRNKSSNGRLNYDYEHTKPATRLDHRHELNKVNLEQKLQRLKQVIGQWKVKYLWAFCGLKVKE